MNYEEYSFRLKKGQVVGDGVRSYSIERINPENTYLRGTPENQRQIIENKNGSLRIIPTPIILDIISAIESHKITLSDIMRKHRIETNLPPLFSALSLDYDPFVLGYDSTINKICEFLLDNRDPIPYQSDAIHKPRLFLPKPFLILAGISGTGKTKWVRDREIPGKGNVAIVPVRPDWHEPSDLLGYISRISGDPKFIPTRFLLFLLSAWRDAWSVEPSLSPSAESVDQMVPFWLCLDEMNLAPVEQYFADYLSVLEQRSWAHGRYSCPPLLPFEPGIDDVVRQALDMNDEDPLWASFKNIGGIPLPPNLVIVGTVNMDETTHGFSRKVLDRALTVELDSIDFSVYGGTSISGYTSEVPWTKLSSVTSALDVSIPEGNKTTVLELLERWNELLDGTPFRIAYRTINESLLIAASLPDRPLEEALDWIAMAKLLPRLEGDEDRLGMDRDGREESYLDEIVADWSVRFGNMWEGSRAKRKIEYMKSRLARSGYTSYWP